MNDDYWIKTALKDQKSGAFIAPIRFGGVIISIRLIGIAPNLPNTSISIGTKTELPSRYEVFRTLLCICIPSTSKLETPLEHLSLVQQGFVERLQKLLSNEIAIISYYDDPSTHFVVWDRVIGLECAAISPADYASLLSKEMGYRGPLGSGKPANTEIGDVIRQWGVRYLPRYIVVSDIDALVQTDRSTSTNISEPVTPSIVIVEIKSTKKGNWSPYRSDIPNYMLMESLSRKAGLPWVILHHVKVDPTRATLWHIPAVSYDEIHGCYSIEITGINQDDVAARLFSRMHDVHSRAFGEWTHRSLEWK